MTILYRFQIELSDIEKGLYRTLEFRTAQHPSESSSYLLTRVIAYALSFQEGIEFSPQGLGDPDAPALRIMSEHGSVLVWIEIGNASSRKLHKAAKIAKKIRIYTYKDVRVLLKDLQDNDVHRQQDFEIFALQDSVLLELGKCLQRDNRWSMVLNEGLLSINTADGTLFELEIAQCPN
jgi:uncharacterized protein YaeQ